MPCEQWYKLLERYRRAAEILSTTVDCLSATDFGQGWRSAEAALKNCVSARTLLLDHEQDHACASGDWETEELVLGDQGQSGG
jgi:hypothetical protein